MPSVCNGAIQAPVPCVSTKEPGMGCCRWMHMYTGGLSFVARDKSSNVADRDIIQAQSLL